MPAVTEVCGWQAARFQTWGFVSSSQPFGCSQAEQTKPSGQRIFAKWWAQASSSGNLLSKAVRDINLFRVYHPNKG